MIILGFIGQGVAVILMAAPILFPIVVSAGFDPYWFAVVLTINMEIGLISPPVGLNLYVINGIAPDIPLRTILVDFARDRGLLFRVYAAAPWPDGSRLVFSSATDIVGSFKNVICRSIMGSSRIFSKGFGVFLVIVPILEPLPAARMIASKLINKNTFYLNS